MSKEGDPSVPGVTCLSGTRRAVKFVDVPEEAARKAMLDMQMPSWAVDAMLELHAISKAGYASGVTDGVQKLLGRPPTRFADAELGA